MASSRARDVKRRLQYCTLHLRACGEEDREAASAEHKNTIIAMLPQGSLSATTTDADDVLAAVTDPQLAPPWKVADLHAIAQAVQTAKRTHKRKAQDFIYVLEFFTLVEWERWKSLGMRGSENILEELIARVKSILGKNLDEHSKKLLTHIWLFLRGNGKDMDLVGRLQALDAFKMRWLRATRDFEPVVYIKKLPPVKEFEQQYPEVFAAAFPVDRPCVLPLQDVSEVKMSDGMARCRGGGIGSAALGQLATPTMIAQQNATNNCQNMMQQHLQLALQQFAGLVRQPSEEIPVQYFDARPMQGRPMRSRQNAQTGLTCAQRAAFAPPYHGARPLGERLSSAASSDSLGQEDAAQPPAFASPAQPDALAPPSLRPTVEPTLPLPSAVAPKPSSPSMLALEDKPGDDMDAVMAHIESMKRTRKRRRDEGEGQVVKKKTKKKVGKKGGKKSNGASEATTRTTSSDLPSAGTQATPKKTKEEASEATPKNKKKGATSLQPTPAKSKWKKPRIEWESSRNQVMCRTGKGGPGSTHRIGFKESGSPEKAWRLAEKWLEKHMAKWKAATG